MLNHSIQCTSPPLQKKNTDISLFKFTFRWHLSKETYKDWVQGSSVKHLFYYSMALTCQASSLVTYSLVSARGSKYNSFFNLPQTTCTICLRCFRGPRNSTGSTTPSPTPTHPPPPHLGRATPLPIVKRRDPWGQPFTALHKSLVTEET